MNPRPSLKLASEGRLVMTFALRQALEILQMPQLELGQWLRAEIEKNPLLEINETSKHISYETDLAAGITLHEHLLSQIRENFSSIEELFIAEQFLEHLDEKGLITSSPESIANCLAKPLITVEKVLSILQTFDPPGVFACSLQEVLLLQLKAKGKENSLAYRLVQNCYDDLLHGRYNAIKKELGTSSLGPAIQTLSRLTFHPAESFKQDPTPPAIPDLRIEKFDGGWSLELIEDEVPKFQLKEEYLELELKSKEEQESLREFKTQAKWIFRSLNRRRKLLREIGRILLRKQASYLMNKGPLKSISIKELSEKLEVHESTLSRALSGKYAMTPRGNIPLRSLISSSPTTETAKEVLEKLICSEDKKNPLTDDELAKELKAKGVPVARRTIAKYRTQLKIGPATQRKHLNKGD